MVCQRVAGVTRLGKVESFRVISAVAGSNGHARYDASQHSVHVLIQLDNGQSAIATVNSEGEINVVQRTGDEASFALIILETGMPASPGNGHLPVAAVEFRYSPGATRFCGIMKFEDSSVVMADNARTPQFYRRFKDPVAGVDSNGHTMLAFEAALAGESKQSNSEILFKIGMANPSVAARKGDPAPGVGGKVFHEFQSLSMIDGHGVLLTASLAPGKQRGCWGMDPGRVLRLLLRDGETIEGKTIRSFEVLTNVRGSEGQRRAWAGPSNLRKVTFHAVFTDGSDGLLTVVIP
jgi:hypothetical protein